MNNFFSSKKATRLLEVSFYYVRIHRGENIRQYWVRSFTKGRRDNRIAKLIEGKTPTLGVPLMYDFTK